jgi:hypothetical protein
MDVVPSTVMVTARAGSSLPRRHQPDVFGTSHAKMLQRAIARGLSESADFGMSLAALWEKPCRYQPTNA